MTFRMMPFACPCCDAKLIVDRVSIVAGIPNAYDDVEVVQISEGEFLNCRKYGIRFEDSEMIESLRKMAEETV